MAFPLSLKFHPQELEITCGARGLPTRCRNRLDPARWRRFRFFAVDPPSFANQMQGDFPPARRPPMFEKINPLPHSQGEPALDDRDRELYAGHRRPDMGGHVVGAFVRMPYRPASSGARRSKKASRSVRTSGAAFSWMSRPAEVCRQNRVKSPVCTPCGASQSKMFCVISTSPRPRDEIRRISTN